MILSGSLLIETTCFDDLAHLDGAFVAFCLKHVISLFPDTQLGGFPTVYIRPTSWERTPSHFDGLDRPVNYWIQYMNSVPPCTRPPGWSSARYVVPIPAGIARVERDQKTVGGPLTRTTGFGVYLLDGGCRHEGERWADLVRSRPHYVNERATWREVWDIGDCSLLIWSHHATCVPVSKATGAWMPNCIYFTEDSSGGGGGGGYTTCHLSVYNIQHQTIWRCTTMEGSAMNPAWITPSLEFRAGIC
uniref:Protein disulfide-isomerase A3 n=1 Tax=Anthurium amnicola TaxID=1678845 RepID=A0A1D1XZS2_9ARAE